MFNKYNKQCKAGACDHVALWNFRLHFEPSCLPPLKKNHTLIFIYTHFSLKDKLIWNSTQVETDFLNFLKN